MKTMKTQIMQFLFPNRCPGMGFLWTVPITQSIGFPYISILSTSCKKSVQDGSRYDGGWLTPSSSEDIRSVWSCRFLMSSSVMLRPRFILLTRLSNFWIKYDYWWVKFSEQNWRSLVSMIVTSYRCIWYQWHCLFIKPENR